MTVSDMFEVWSFSSSLGGVLNIAALQAQRMERKQIKLTIMKADTIHRIARGHKEQNT